MFGRPDIELNKDGAVWRFSNEGNRGAFALHPEVYTPRFGGYDPVAIGRDRSVPGHPMFWIASRRVWHSSPTPAALSPRPSGKWPEVVRSLGQ